ncbi:MAG: hypothetical protein ACK5F5_05740, partial [Gammaproteobacteria bacterium]
MRDDAVRGELRERTAVLGIGIPPPEPVPQRWRDRRHYAVTDPAGATSMTHDGLLRAYRRLRLLREFEERTRVEFQ